MRKFTFLTFVLFICTIAIKAQFTVIPIVDEDFESTPLHVGTPYGHGFPSNFNCKKQTTWYDARTTQTANNPYPYTLIAAGSGGTSTPVAPANSLWKDLYGSTATSANKTYNVEIMAEEGAGKAGASQCLKINLTDLAYSVNATNASGESSPATVRIRSNDGIVSFGTNENVGKYAARLWAKTADGSTKKVFLNGTADTLSITGTWTQYNLKRYVTGTTATALAIDFVRQPSKTDYSVLIDGFTLVQLPTLTAHAATNILSDGFTANWTAVAGATSYTLAVQTTADGGTTWTSVTGFPLTITDATAVSSVITGLTPNTQYRYRVNATDGTYTLENTAWITETTLNSSGVDNVIFSTLKIDGHKVSINLSRNLPIQLYNVDGKLLKSMTSVDGMNKFNIEKQGVYVLKVGDYGRKLIIQ